MPGLTAKISVQFGINYSFWPPLQSTGPQSVRGCSASALCSTLPRCTCLRLILLCICPPLCAGALWPMPAWVWRDVRSVFFCFFLRLLSTCRLSLAMTGGDAQHRHSQLMSSVGTEKDPTACL